jgi:hypothetical protein
MRMPIATVTALTELGRSSRRAVGVVMTVFDGADPEPVLSTLGEDATVVSFGASLSPSEAADLVHSELERAGVRPETRARFDAAALEWLYDRSAGVPARLEVEAGRMLDAIEGDAQLGLDTLAPEPGTSPPDPHDAPAAPAASSATPSPAPASPESRRVGPLGLPRGLGWAGVSFVAGVALILGLDVLRGAPLPPLPEKAPTLAAAEEAMRGDSTETPPEPAPVVTEEVVAEPVVEAIVTEAAVTEAAVAQPVVTEEAVTEPSPEVADAQLAALADEATWEALAPAAIPPPPPAGYRVNRGVIAPGRSLAASLRAQGLPDSVAVVIAREVADAFDFRQARAGQAYRIVRDRDGQILDFRYLISPSDSLYLRRAGQRYVVERVTGSGDGVAAETVLLDVDASPWASIRLDDSPLGETPLAEIPVPSGRHRLTARFPDGRLLERVVRIDATHRHVVLP